MKQNQSRSSAEQKTLKADAARGNDSPYLGRMLNEAAFIIRRDVTNELQPFGLTPRQFGALDAVARREPLSQRVLGEICKIDRTTTTAQVDLLEAAGLIRREANPNDRREHSLVTTDKGATIIVEARAAVRRAEKRFIKNLPREKCEMLFDILRLVLEGEQSADSIADLPRETNSLCVENNRPVA